MARPSLSKCRPEPIRRGNTDGDSGGTTGREAHHTKQSVPSLLLTMNNHFSIQSPPPPPLLFVVVCCPRSTFSNPSTFVAPNRPKLWFSLRLLPSPALFVIYSIFSLPFFFLKVATIKQSNTSIHQLNIFLFYLK
jgi:hypothetical protein